MKSVVKKRILVGIIGAALIIFCICFSAWTYFALFFLICLFSQLEFYKNVAAGRICNPALYLGLICGLTLFTSTFLIEKEIISQNYYYLLFPFLSLIFLFELFKPASSIQSERSGDPDLPGHPASSFTNIAFTFLGIIYIALPLALLNIAAFSTEHSAIQHLISSIRHPASSIQYYSYQVILGILLIVWANDTLAYFVGINFGRTKLFQRISPKKTWEGTIGGGVASLITALILSFYFKDLLLWQWMTLSLIIIISSTLGDLVESLFKRSLNIKDSATTIPGHGGFLDRFDGLFLAAPFVTAFLKFL
ncbi:MAG: phosphatidate cytidylyltransferase [Cytophagales bacterium]|nr:phosphatidate cytidylyltransferase [Cytophagales bacterium]